MAANKNGKNFPKVYRFRQDRDGSHLTIDADRLLNACKEERANFDIVVAVLNNLGVLVEDTHASRR